MMGVGEIGAMARVFMVSARRSSVAIAAPARFIIFVMTPRPRRRAGRREYKLESPRLSQSGTAGIVGITSRQRPMSQRHKYPAFGKRRYSTALRGSIIAQLSRRNAMRLIMRSNFCAAFTFIASASRLA